MNDNLSMESLAFGQRYICMDTQICRYGNVQSFYMQILLVCVRGTVDRIYVHFKLKRLNGEFAVIFKRCVSLVGHTAFIASHKSIGESALIYLYLYR